MGNNNHFRTSDLNFAAYLYAQGVILKDIDFSEYRAVFIFEQPSKELITAFQAGNASVKVLAYNNAINELKARLMRRYGNGGR